MRGRNVEHPSPTAPTARLGPEVILAAQGVTVAFDTPQGLRHVVRDVDLEVRRGSVTAIVGESGSGKTQLIHALFGLTRGLPGVTAGSAWIQTLPGQAAPLLVENHGAPGRPRFRGDYRVLNEQLTVIFQGADSHLNPFHTVRSQILRRAAGLPGPPRRNTEQSHDFVARALTPFFPEVTPEIDRIARSFPCELSGGQQVRLGLCLALLSPAPLIIADEPTTGLDPGLRLEIYRILRRAVESHGRTLLLVSHDADLVARFARDLIVMHEGKILERTSGGAVAGLRDEYSRSLFLPVSELVRMEARRLNVPALAPPRAAVPGDSVLLEAHGLHKRFLVRSGSRTQPGHVQAVVNVDLEVRRGELVGLVGESGCGKSTLARILAGLVRADSGTVLFRSPGDGKELQPTNGGYRRHVQLLHQNPDAMLHPRVPVRALFADSRRLWGQRCLFPDVESFIEFAQILPATADQRLPSLSGGERRRVGLGRVLAGRPELVIADEVVSGLDRATQARLLCSIQALRRAGLTLLVISHDLELVRQICDRVFVMRHGRILQVCPAEDLVPGCSRLHEYTRFLLDATMLHAGNADSAGDVPACPTRA